MSGPYLVPVSFRQACDFVDNWHRHHRAPKGHKFSIGAAIDGEVVGVVTVGRPVSRHQDDGVTLEVTRTATDGSRNVNSLLYGAAWRVAKGLGYARLITYTQQGESGQSLRAAGWVVIAERPATPGWSRVSRARKLTGTENVNRLLWQPQQH